MATKPPIPPIKPAEGLSGSFIDQFEAIFQGASKTLKILTKSDKLLKELTTDDESEGES